LHPTPIEAQFADNPYVEQQCLVGLGMNKTIMVAVVSETMRDAPRDVIEASVLEAVEQLNGVVEKHERMGGAILTYEPWSIENGVLTPTLKIKRDQISDRFGEEASAMAVESAESKTLIIRWC
jgi:long-chain acyl-CoA synthetase